MPKDAPETIVALASGTLPCAVALVRVSGALAPDIAERLAGGAPAPRTASLRTLRDSEGAPLDDAIVIFYPGPHSYTGEDVLEISLHGSAPLVQAAIDAICTAGARHARAGEFTERAFLNGRIDLVRAEAVADLISAQSLRAARAAHNSLRGAYSRAIESIQQALTELRTNIEASLDFPEEDTPEGNSKRQTRAINDTIAQAEALLAGTQAAIVRSHGLRLALIGEANVGKSTLLNTLSGEDLAIVSEQAGTTRDAISADLNIGGHTVRIIDTAGIRASDDDIEREGMRRARQAAQAADRIWWLAAPDSEGGFASTAELNRWLGLSTPIPIDVIHNKIDLGGQEPKIKASENGGFSVWLSAKTGAGIEQLGTMVEKILGGSAPGEGESDYSARRRHADALSAAVERLRQAERLTQDGDSPELIAEELRLAQTHLDEILGKLSSDDLLGSIFSSFCIGK